MGVRRAVDMVLDASNRNQGPICTYGPLIHNPQVLEILEEKGVSVINTIPEKGQGTVLIRAHGVPPEVKAGLNRAEFIVVDATCPRVIKVQTIIKKHAKQGFSVIIIGDDDHPEVIGLLGYAGEKGVVVNSLDDLKRLDAFDNAIIVAQTTQNITFFKQVKQWAGQNYPHYKIFNTICDSTQKRQDEVGTIAESVDAVIVVGGYNSGNTQRLVEIARQSGKPAYHIEKEAELNADALNTARNIGITAGASTPNWIIKKVYRKLEHFSFNRGQIWRRMIFPLQRSLLLTNIYVALGAGCLSYACTRLQGIEHSFSNTFIAFLYIMSMHTFNNLTLRKTDRYNDPDRAGFYEKNKTPLFTLAVVANIAGLVAAYTMGWFPFFLLFAMSVMGLLYNLRLVPKHYKIGRYKRLKDIPGSKTVLIAAGWGMMTSIFPALSINKLVNGATLWVFFWAFGIVFVRTAFFDILDMQGDRIMGKETIPILIGEDRTKRLLKMMLVALFFTLMIPSLLGSVSSLGFILGCFPIVMYLVIFSHEHGYLLPGLKFVFLVETHFILTGIIAYLWHAIW